MSGWICLHRKLLDWEWYDDANTMRLFVHCLLRANFEDTSWRGIDIKRGAFVTSIATLSKELGLTIKQIRGSLDKLKRTGEVAMSTTAKYSIISIPCYNDYQDKGQAKGQAKGQVKGKQKGITGANKGQAEGKQRATDNKDNKENNSTNEQANKVIDYLNLKAGTKYRHTGNNQKLIKARLEFFTVEDCMTVIDNKCDEWLGDEKMAQYLRPPTLFQASKFESYLNTVKPVSKADKRSSSIDMWAQGGFQGEVIEHE